MEGTTELNPQDDTIQGPTETQVQIGKETQLPRDLPVESTSMTADTTAPPPISQDPEWSEHFPFLASSTNAFMENTDGMANLNRNPDQTENSGSNAEAKVEELTLKNYKSTTNTSAGSSSSSGEKPTMRKGLWGNFTRIAGSLSREIAPINQPVSWMVEGVSDVNPPYGPQRTSIPLFAPQRALRSTNRPQNLSESTQIGAKSAFKGKGVVQKGVVEKPKLHLDTVSDTPRKTYVKSDDKSLYGGGFFDSYNSSSHKGATLREFLKPRHQKISKSTKMQIFRQIVEFLNVSHSQDLALKDLRPSYFMILPLYQVKYTGGFIRRELTSSAQMDESFRRKRYLDQKEIQKGSDWVSRLKHQKVGDWGIFSRSSNTGCDFRENTSIGGDAFKFEERWYGSPEEQTEYACPFSSNVYSLGVLLFELFSYFETWELQSAAMADLHHRILPPNFLAEFPKEAGFCLWLLHPDPASRPKARDILLCDLLNEGQNQTMSEEASISFEEEETESELLLSFLMSLKEQKEKKAAKLMSDLGCLEADISQVERIHTSRTLTKDPTNQTLPGSCEERLMRSMRHLEAGYYSVRSQLEISRERTVKRSDSGVLKLRDSYNVQREGNVDVITEPTDKLSGFFGDLCKYARYDKFEVRGCLKNSEILSSSSVICSLSFDRDEEYFAAAGVTKKIKIFEFESLLNDNVDIHYPLIEMPSRAKLSCVCWNSYIKSYLVSTDYDGVVQVWDATTGHGFTQFTEHRKRAWSVNFSQVDPTMLTSGSDDCSVKIWNINERNSVETIRNVANVCCVQYSPYTSRVLAFGSADYKVYCYDLRNTRLPWCTLSGHSKAVSYVRFLDPYTLVSASTDNTLKIWDLTRTASSGLSTDACQLTLSGHANEKNFVGLSVHDGYITCGSETNDVYAYYKSFPMPITSHNFGSIDPITGQDSEDNSLFVSSVCWRGRSNMVVSANSSGSIKVLQLV